MALAQITPVPASTSLAVDGNRVDLVDGSYNYSHADITLGEGGPGALSFIRSYGVAGWTNNFRAYIDHRVESGTSYIYVTFGSTADKFSVSGTTYTALAAMGTALTSTTAGTVTTYTYTARDGTQAIFTEQSPATNLGSRIESLKLPSGDLRTYTYKTATLSGATYERLQSVTNNVGYQIKLTYASNTLSSSTVSDWQQIASVTGINNVVEYCDPMADSCSVSSGWPKFTYTASSTSLTATDSLMSRTWTYALDSSTGKLVGITRPSTSAMTISNTAGKVSGITDGGSWTYGYVDVGSTRTTTVTDPASHVRTITANLTLKRITADQNALGNTTAYQYDGNGRRTRVTHPEGNYEQSAYDARGNVTSVTRVAKSGSGLSNIVTTATFPSSCTNIYICNEPTATVDGLSHQTDFTYDTTHGGVLTETSPAPTTGAVRPNVNDVYTLLTAKVKNSGGTLVTEPTSVYRQTLTWQCVATSTCTATSGDSVGSALTYYDTSNLSTSLLEKKGGGTTLWQAGKTVDAVGNVASIDGPLYSNVDTTNYLYDAARERVGEIGPDPDGTGSLLNPATRYTYNADGLLTLTERGTDSSAIDPGWSTMTWSGFTLLQKTAIGYDSLNRKIQETVYGTGSALAVTQFNYDVVNRLICSVRRMNASVFSSLPSSACTLGTTGSDGPDRVTHRVYDAADELTQVQEAYNTSGVRTTKQLTYTANGLVDYLSDAKGNKSEYAYDGFDRKAKLYYPLLSNPTTIDTADYEQWTYDADDNITSWRNRNTTSSVTNYSYDNLDRMTTKTPPGSEPVVTYTYDNLNHMLSAAQTGDTRSFTYDAQGNILTEVSPLGTVTLTYDAIGNRSQITYPGGSYFTYDYWRDNRMKTILENAPISAPTTDSYVARFTYDNLGNRIDLTHGAGLAAPQDTLYTYDDISRLASLRDQLDRNTTPVGTNDVLFTYGYNAASQITSRLANKDSYAFTDHYNVSRGYTSNGLNQYTASGSATPSYDQRGNLTGIGGATYTYDSVNRLTAVGGTLAAASLSYDPLGRLSKVVQGSTTTQFLWDGDDLIAEYDGSGTALGRYVYGPDDDDPIAWYTGSTVAKANRRYLFPDERGSVVAVSDWQGITVALNRYDEYGIPGSANLGRLQYTGQLWIPEIGAYYYKARVYSPTLGRFLQTDPRSYDEGMHLYAYVGDEPVNLTDTSGEQCGVHIPTTSDGDEGEIGVHAYITCKDQAVYYRPTGGTGRAGTSSAAGHGAASPVPAAPKPQKDNRGGFDVPADPCAQAGNAPDPSTYRSLGDAIGPLALPLFARGQPLDAQSKGSSRSYGNYVYGAYFAGTGASIDNALSGANFYAGTAQYPAGTPMSHEYPNLPQANVQNITNGYTAAKNGTLCTTHH